MGSRPGFSCAKVLSQLTSQLLSSVLIKTVTSPFQKMKTTLCRICPRTYGQHKETRTVMEGPVLQSFPLSFPRKVLDPLPHLLRKTQTFPQTNSFFTIEGNGSLQVAGNIGKIPCLSILGRIQPRRMRTHPRPQIPPRWTFSWVDLKN